MLVCGHCGEENPDRARFCGRCGSALAPPAGPGGEERKIVTVVFCELLGVGEGGDPEDLQQALAPYHGLVRQQVTNFGGTIDKFMGPTVLGVFGAPVAHEDDPERAVRAALNVVEAMPGLAERNPHLPAAVRVGVNTGEAVVARPGSGPQIGEAVTGDVVNTASRLLQIAAEGEIVVGEPTHRATDRAFSYEDRDPVVVKGKAEPLEVWRAVEARSRFGVDARPQPQTPFIGRREERTLLEGAFRRAVSESSVQLVTITGEPGVGKTRLIQELGSFVDEFPDLIRWRQGRCLPYGEGISFWALAEIVKAEAGILESDPPADVEPKLRGAVEPFVADPGERDWMQARLAPLAGLPRSAADVPREELFTAWRRWVEALAASSPTILVFEDLHWADEPMLAFIEHVVDWIVGLPLLVVCAARPELYQRHPNWGGGRRNATSIALAPFSSQETAMLVSALLDSAVLPAQTQATLLERSGGNPLYAEEFVRMLRDQGIVDVARGVSGAAAEVAVPQTLQLLIGARLDTLPLDHKVVLQDAAVAGKVFWAGAVASMAGIGRDEAEVILHELVRREFVRPSRISTVKGEAEYAFWHVLVQDVAYGQIPRAARGVKHLAVASWIRSVAGDRVSDLSELLAHHYGEALELARATGQVTPELERDAGSALLLAGDRAKRLDATRAETFYRRAREVLAVGDPDRTRALVEAAEVAGALGRFAQAEEDFALAMREFQGDDLGLGETMARLSRLPTKHGEEARGLLREAITLLEREGPGPELARACTRMAAHLYVAGESAEAIPWAERAIGLADELGLEDEEVLALQYRGAARSALGDREGLDDLREALRRALELGLGEETAVAYNNLAYALWAWEGPSAASAVWADMTEFCEVRGFTTMAMWAEGGALEALFDLGDWDRVLRIAGDMLEWEQAHGATRVGTVALIYRSWVFLRRGELEPVAATAEGLLARARDIQYAEYLAPSLLVVAELRYRQGDLEGSAGLLDEFLEATEDQPDYRRMFLPVAVRVLIRIGQVGRAEELVDGAGEPTATRQELSLLTCRAILAEHGGDLARAEELYARSVRVWTDYGFPLERGRSLLGRGRCLLGLGRTAEAAEALRKARDVMSLLGARVFVDEADELLGRALARTS
ncbi:MAG TPA: AAA family ATPase [Actinomycetota bacterium]